MEDTEYLSKEKYEALEKELEFLRTTKRKEIADSLEYARGLGDLSENAEYQEAREAQEQLEERIASIKSILKRAVIIKSHHSTVVELGSTVVIQKEGSKEKQKFSVVGSAEANIAESKISNESPLGAAMLGKKKGEKFSVTSPRGSTSYSIVEIE